MSTVPPKVTHRRVEVPPVCIVALTGEQDLSTAQDVDMVLTTAVASGDPVVVDLLNATFADSSILGAILRAGERAEDRGLAVVLPADGEVRRLFDLVGAQSMISTFATLHEALAWCNFGDESVGQEEPAGE
ncbi:MAG TPA: STAS domain-containing protein [Gaiellales bacterium]|nr:STAS domain-containing protein [Gaiellales bacterium]